MTTMRRASRTQLLLSLSGHSTAGKVLLATGLVMGITTLASAQDVVEEPLVINEIMQNPSAVSDGSGEWLELYNPNAFDIDIGGWTLRDDDVDSLIIDGSLIVPAGGYVVLGPNGDIGTNGGLIVDYAYGSGWFLSNGADEVVLVNTDGAEVDRVVYDGGPSFPDPNGASMALTSPEADNLVGANWCESQASYGSGDLGTPGTANDCSIEEEAVLVISEIMQNPSAVGDSSGEWLEIYNAGTSAVDINGWEIRDNDSDSHVIDNGGPLLIPAGEYLVLGNNIDIATNGGATVNYSYGGSWFLANGADEVVLLDTNGTEIDRVEYDGGPAFPDPNGASMALADLAADNNLGENWCESTTSFGDGNLGTPGAPNVCVEPGANLVINEIMQNPSAVSDSAGEWLELHNPNAFDVDIDGWTIADNDSDSHVITNGGPLVIPAGGFLVLGNNADSATNGNVDVAYSYGTGWFLSNSADEVALLDTNLTEIDRVEYDGGPSFPDPTGASMELRSPELDNNDGINWCEASSIFGAGDAGTPGVANNCEPEPVVVTPIFQIQGAGNSSPLEGETVTVEAVVIGDFQGVPGSSELHPEQLSGFYVQDLVEDGDAATSEGLFVYCDTSCAANPVAVGDTVTVTGVVQEFFGMTQLNVSSGSVLVTGTAPLPSPALVSLPVAALDDFEAFEGMLVTFVDTLTVSEYFQLGRFGEVVLYQGGRPYQFTHVNTPDPVAAAAYEAKLEKRRITLDDDANGSNEALFEDLNVFFPRPGLSTSNFFRGGDTITGLTGVLDYSFSKYRVRPVLTEFDYSFQADNPRPATPADVGGSLKVVSANVLNYFSTVDNGDSICAPSGTLGCRGADSTQELERQTAKLVSALCEIDGDILGLSEIENDASGTGSLDVFVGALNAAGCGSYAYVDAGPLGGDAIKVALVYRSSTVTPVTEQTFVVDDSVDANYRDDRNRPTLVQVFEDDASGERVIVAAHHLKSKGSDCDDLGDTDQNDGQGNCAQTRAGAAAIVADFIANEVIPDAGTDRVLVIGDLNAYKREDAVGEYTSRGYVDLIEVVNGNDAYSYVFDGRLGYLDHALGLNVADVVTGVTEWHINADEINLLDYNDDVLDTGEASFEEKPDNLPLFDEFDPGPFRSSDHDPVVIGLDLGPVVIDVPGDLDDDGDVDTSDYRLFLGVYRQSAGSDDVAAEADYNGNGVVDFADFGIWRSHYAAYRSLSN